jgi:ATP-dependent exoDNAse (exonuclease V) beta subunit
MEQAENKRLLYVACTRAADLLILSGSPEEDDTWLKTLAGAWGVAENIERNKDGLDAGEEIFTYPGFTLRLIKAAPLPDAEPTSRPPAAALTQQVPQLEALPLLARPLPPRLATWPVAVTHVPSARDTEEEEIERPRPVVRLEGGAPAGRRPWRFLVGNLAHRALADWNCLALPDADLREHLRRWAVRGGLSAPEDVASAVNIVAKQLGTLRATPLYTEICAAQERHAEVPLSIRAGERILHGVLDLLYRDRRGQWRLLDWKTERLGHGQSIEEAAAGETTRQMAVYRQAVTQILDYSVVAAICFLSEGAQVHEPGEEKLAAAWAELVAER